MKKIITPEVIVAHIQCPSKSYFMLFSDQIGEDSEYIAVLEDQKIINQNSYLEHLKKQCLYIQKGDEKNLVDGSNLLIDVTLKSEEFEASCNVLTKVSVPSLLGQHSYEPTIVVGTHQINSNQRFELFFVAYVLSQIQGVIPTNGKIIGAGLKPHKINLVTSYTVLEPVIQDLQKLIRIESPEAPSLILNKHCICCQFQLSCRAQAEKEDNISLLAHATKKMVNHYAKKGIFTIKQLSYLYKPRRRNKRARKAPVVLHKIELQALAIRTSKTYIQELPQLVRKPIEIFLDMEGIPDQQYEYLIGLIISSEDNPPQRYSFWANNQEEEIIIWQQFVEVINHYTDAPIYHYGDYEVRAITKMVKRYSSEVELENIKNRLTNINAYIYGQVYFPTYSNGLKDIGKFLGANWTSPEASGIQSIVWRYHWENQQDNKYKILLSTYNHEDCQALKLLIDSLSNIKSYADTLSEIDFVDQPKRIAAEIGTELHNQFDIILKSAHADYDKKKISLKKDEKHEKIQSKRRRGGQKGHVGHTKSHPRANKAVLLPTRENCPEHQDESLIESKRIAESVIVNIVFIKTGIKKTVTKYTGKKGFCQKCKRHYNPIGIDIEYLIYGHGFKAWVIYNRLFLRLPYEVIVQTLADQFCEKISQGSIVNFLRYFSDFYSETEQLIIQKMLQSSFIHADETKINIQGVEQYVWVFTDGIRVLFKLTPTRESDLVHEFLDGYLGTLVSDFYPGYDSVKCKQQKCWVHLIREINDDLWKSPFDSEFEEFSIKVKDLIVPILNMVEEHGLKKRNLSKSNILVDQFYKDTVDKSYKSDLALKYKKRFLRYRSSLFSFINEDNIPWNNNMGERAIRHLAVQRKISGSFFESLMPHYLRLLEIMQTCRFQNKSFLKFLLSKEKDIDKFRR